jgi:hypothetical protein
MGFDQHPEARVQGNNLARFPNDTLRCTGYLPGADADIKHRHPGLQAGTTQGITPVPHTGTKGHDVIDPRVMTRTPIEHPADESSPLVLLLVKVRQRRMRRHFRSIGTAISRHVATLTDSLETSEGI